MNPYIPVAPHGIDPSLAVGITNPGGPNPMEGNVLLCSVRIPSKVAFGIHPCLCQEQCLEVHLTCATCFCPHASAP